MAILVGNSFPTSLIAREVVVRPISLSEFREILAQKDFVSFWGHDNTLAAANAVAGVDLKPAVPRPALRLTAVGLPSLEGEESQDVYVLTPAYRPGFRPQIGVEVGPADIVGWSALHFHWV